MARAFKRLPHRNTVAIVGDGHTERIYFSDVRDTDRPANLAIFPDFPSKIGSYQGVLERATEIHDEYDIVFALIDMDAVIQQKQMTAYVTAKSKAMANGIVVLENNPCFEIWFLVHFVHTGKLFSNCQGVSDQLKTRGRIPGYCKAEKFLLNARLYKTLKDSIHTAAIPHARLLEKDRANQDEMYPRAETFRFFEWYINTKQ